jgi:O-antigen ligase
LPRVGRLALWEVAARMAGERPLLGVGPDNFRLVYGKYLGMSRWDPAIHTNNLYLEWLSTTGILGLLAFCWLSWRLAKLVASSLALPGGDPRRGAGSFWIWKLALAASLVAWYVHGFFDYFFAFTPAYVAFWLIAALCVRAASVDEHRWRES